MWSFTSCSKIYVLSYGIKNVKLVDEKEIARQAKKQHIPLQDNYELDTAFFGYLFSLDTNLHKSAIKNHYQPLQAMYYTSSGNLSSFMVNCYAGGFPNLKWNRNQAFSIFPPKEQALNDSILPLNRHLNYITKLSASKDIKAEGYDYFVIVYWNRFMGRQSKRFVKIVQENSKLSNSVKVIYVNNDNIFLLDPQVD